MRSRLRNMRGTFTSAFVLLLVMSQLSLSQPLVFAVIGDLAQVSPGKIPPKEDDHYLGNSSFRVKLEYPRSFILQETVGDLSFLISLNESRRRIEIQIPPEFKVTSSKSYVWSNITNNYGNMGISKTSVSVSNGTSQIERGNYSVRIFDVTAPSVVGRYFFKVFTDGTSIGMMNFPSVVVSADPNPAYISGTVRYGGHLNAYFYGLPIASHDPNTKLLTGLLSGTEGGKVQATGITADRRIVVGQAFFNSSSSEYTLYGLAAGLYRLNATAAGFAPAELPYEIAVKPGQSMEHVDIFVKRSPILSVVALSRRMKQEEPWGYTYYRGIVEKRTITLEILDMWNVTVALLNATANPLRASHEFTYNGSRDLDGHIPQDKEGYVAGIGTGRYYVRIWVNRYVQVSALNEWAWTSECAVVFTQEEQGRRIDIELERTGVLNVTVHFRSSTAVQQSPIPFDGTITVKAYDINDSLRASNSTRVYGPTAGHTIAAYGNAQIATAQSVFGGASGLFDGTGDYLSVPDSADWNFGTGDFTIDTWIRLNSLPAVGAWMTIYSQYVNLNNHVCLFIYNNAGTYQILPEVVSGGVVVLSMPRDVSLAVNTWHHIAWVRSGTANYVFLDGVQQGPTDTDTGTFPDLPAPVFIGSYDGTLHCLDGWLDEFRVSKDIARWTGNFTPPTAAYVPDSYTRLLLHMDGPGGSQTFTDDRPAFAGNTSVSVELTGLVGTRGYGIPRGVYKIEATLAGYVQPSEHMVTIGDGICSTSFYMLLLGRLNVTVFSTSWQRPFELINWTYHRSTITVEIRDAYGVEVYTAVRGYQDQSKKYVTLDDVKGLDDGNYSIHVFTYGYVQRQDVFFSVRKGEIADISVRVTIGVQIGVTVVFEKQRIASRIDTYTEYWDPDDPKVPVRFEVYDSKAQFVAADITYVLSADKPTSCTVTLAGFRSYYGNAALRWINYYDTTDGSSHRDYGLEQDLYTIKVYVPGYHQPMEPTIDARTRGAVSVVLALHRMGRIYGMVHTYNTLFENYTRISWVSVDAVGEEMTLRTCTLDGAYELWMTPGPYLVVFSLPAYETKALRLQIPDGSDVQMNLQLLPFGMELQSYASSLRFSVTDAFQVGMKHSISKSVAKICVA